MQLSLFTVVPMILVLASASAESHLRGLQARKLCSSSGSGPQHGGDCSNTPTYCGRGWGPRPPTQDIPPGDNVVGCSYHQPSRHIEEDIPVEYSDEARACYKTDNMSEKICSREVYDDFPNWCSSNHMMRFGGYRGSCSGTNNCLNLDFHCADGEYCEMSCSGQNSCNGLTMHCADNQSCEIQCTSTGCVGAKVICGEGMVARGLRCEPVDRPDDCGSQIQPLTEAPTIAPTVSPTTAAPTTSPTTAPTASPTEPIILTPIISYTCVGVTCSDGSDGSTCGSDGGCCPFGNTPSKGQCSCGTSWSDANVNKIPCELTQQQPESQPETVSPTSNPTSESEPETASPTPNPTAFQIGSGCCSQNFRTCATNGSDSKESCELLGSMIWLENGDLPQQCLEQDSACTDDLNACCPGLTCDGDQWYKQCKFMPNAGK